MAVSALWCRALHRMYRRAVKTEYHDLTCDHVLGVGKISAGFWRHTWHCFRCHRSWYSDKDHA